MTSLDPGELLVTDENVRGVVPRVAIADGGFPEPVHTIAKADGREVARSRVAEAQLRRPVTAGGGRDAGVAEVLDGEAGDAQDAGREVMGVTKTELTVGVLLQPGVGEWPSIRVKRGPDAPLVVQNPRPLRPDEGAGHAVLLRKVVVYLKTQLRLVEPGVVDHRYAVVIL